MITRTWPYGARHRGKVLTSESTRAGALVQLIEDLTASGEAHVLIDSGDPDAAAGDEGDLTFCPGGPNGGYWRFQRSN